MGSYFAVQLLYVMCLVFYHVSVLQVKIPSMKASGGIHLTGSMARPPFL